MTDSQTGRTPNRDDINQLNKAHNRTVEQARRELQKIWNTVMVRYDGDPAAQRDALLELVSALAGKYADVDSAAAAEWYETMRLKWFDDDFEVSVGYDDNTRWIREGIRTQAGALWGDDPDKLRRYLMANMERWVKQGGRDTIARNVERDPRKPRFARVPQGPTCGWCVMLASRGWVYSIAEAAGELKKYHNDCNCEIVPSWDKDKPIVEGYDPDDLYQRYLKCRETVEDGLESRYPDERIMVVDRKTRERRWENLNEFTARMIAREMDQRDRRWLYDGTIPEPEYESERARRELKPHERATVDALAENGFRVMVRERSSKQGVRTPDTRINGVNVDLKSPEGDGKNTVDQLLRYAVRQGASGAVVHLQGGRSVIDFERCRSDIVKALRRRNLDYVMLIGYDGTIRRIIRETASHPKSQ